MGDAKRRKELGNPVRINPLRQPAVREQTTDEYVLGLTQRLDKDKPFPRMGRCFENAQRLCAIDTTGRTLYHEGVYKIKTDKWESKPFGHGWNSVDGKRVDMTINDYLAVYEEWQVFTRDELLRKLPEGPGEPILDLPNVVRADDFKSRLVD